MKRNVFYISDGTGITAETLGNSLITQFEGVEFIAQSIPYVNSVDKAQAVADTIKHTFESTGAKPLVFTTLVNPEIRNILENTDCKLLDLFQAFLKPMETEMQMQSTYTIGRSHSIANEKSYENRMHAVNYALANDDGVGSHNYKQADVIIVGVSRCGKTPTCLYLALQFGVLTANYPMTEDDIRQDKLPDVLRPHKAKLFGLTIDPRRLSTIRSERRPNSRYASIEQCRIEVNEVEALFRKENIPVLNTTSHSIEEISTKILAQTGISRHLF